MFKRIFDKLKQKFSRKPIAEPSERFYTLPDLVDRFPRPMRKIHANAKPKGYAEKRRRLRAIQKESRRRNRV